MRIEAWDQKSMSWTFDWKKWFMISHKKAQLSMPRTKRGSALEWLSTNDLYMLQQLMLDAKRSHTDMIRAIEKHGRSISPQTFGRRLRLLEGSCIERYRVTVDPSAFNIVTNILIRGQGESEFLQDLCTHLVLNPIPFELPLAVESPIRKVIQLQAPKLGIFTRTLMMFSIIVRRSLILRGDIVCSSRT